MCVETESNNNRYLYIGTISIRDGRSGFILLFWHFRADAMLEIGQLRTLFEYVDYLICPFS